MDGIIQALWPTQRVLCAGMEQGKAEVLRPRTTSGEKARAESYQAFHVSLDVSGKPLKILRSMDNVLIFEFNRFRFTAHPHLKSHKT